MSEPGWPGHVLRSPYVASAGRTLAATDPAVGWEGVESLERFPTGVRPWRLPHERIDLFPGDDLRSRARMAAGVRVSLRTDSRAVTVDLTVRSPEVAPVDVVVEGELAATLPLAGAGPDEPDGRRQRVTFRGLGPVRKTVEIWLPHFGEVLWHGLVVDGSASVDRSWRTRPRWITYGSSITQCRQAPSPARTWPALVARDLDLDLRCLGFGGQAKLDPMVARLIRDTRADVISLCLGINMYAQAYERLFLPAVLGFVATVRDGHPRTPIVVISPICSPDRETTPGQDGGMTLAEIRAAVADGVRRLRAAGDANLHLVDGLDVLGPADAGSLPDGLHPDGPGYALMAQRLAPRLAARLPAGSGADRDQLSVG